MKQYLRWNPETNTITGEMLMSKEMKHKKEVKKPKKMKHDDAAMDSMLIKKEVKKGCMK